MPTRAFTIAKLAEAAQVGVEAVRYYQRRGLLNAPPPSNGGFRQYAPSDVSRLQFIKRAQDLGFSLNEIEELISLNHEPDQLRVRAIAAHRVEQIHQRVAQLQAMAAALQILVGCCEQAGPHDACPIIAALADPPQTAGAVTS